MFRICSFWFASPQSFLTTFPEVFVEGAIVSFSFLSAFGARAMFTFLALQHKQVQCGHWTPTRVHLVAVPVCDICGQDTACAGEAQRVSCFVILGWHLCYFGIMFFWLHWSITLTETLLGARVRDFGGPKYFSYYQPLFFTSRKGSGLPFPLKGCFLGVTS